MTFDSDAKEKDFISDINRNQKESTKCESCDETLAAGPLYFCDHSGCKHRGIFFCEDCLVDVKHKKQSHTAKPGDPHVKKVTEDLATTEKVNATMNKLAVMHQNLEIEKRNVLGCWSKTRDLAGELAVASQQFWMEEIKWDEMLKVVARSAGAVVVSSACTAIAGGATAAGGYGGGYAGAAIGSAICPGAGTVIGAIIGAMAGGATGLLMGTAVAEDLYANNFPRPTNSEMAQMVRDAVVYFHFKMSDLEDPTIFNAENIRKKVRLFSLETHPDRQQTHSERAKWDEMQAHLGVLMALLNKKTAAEGNLAKKAINYAQ